MSCFVSYNSTDLINLDLVDSIDITDTAGVTSYVFSIEKTKDIIWNISYLESNAVTDMLFNKMNNWFKPIEFNQPCVNLSNVTSISFSKLTITFRFRKKEVQVKFNNATKFNVCKKNLNK